MHITAYKEKQPKQSDEWRENLSWKHAENLQATANIISSATKEPANTREKKH